MVVFASAVATNWACLWSFREESAAFIAWQKSFLYDVSRSMVSRRACQLASPRKFTRSSCAFFSLKSAKTFGIFYGKATYNNIKTLTAAA